MGLTVATIFGGVKYGPQMKALAAGVDVVVATPGRLMDHLQEESLDLNGVEIFVLDEADQMLDLGFVKPIRQIVSRMPGQRQNLFFSATMPTEIGKLAGELLKEPGEGPVTPQATTVERINQSVIFIEAGASAPCWPRCSPTRLHARLVFTRTKRGADKVAPIWKPAASKPPPSTATRPRASANAPWPPSRPASCAFWSPPTSPPAASTSTASATCELRAAQRAGSLCPPHRPYGPRGQGRHRHQLLRR
jgi:hypothetical protein